MIAPIIVSSVLLIAGVAYEVKRRQKKWFEKKREEDLRKHRLFLLLKGKLPAIEACLSEHKYNISFQHYFGHTKKQSWKERHRQLYDSVKDLKMSDASLPREDIEIIADFLDSYATLDKIVNTYNSSFVDSEIQKYAWLFDNVEKRKLDRQQRTAVVSDEDNNLIIAGAGSGKTTTIVGKVSYILERGYAKPEEILLISFTNDSAATLARRLDNPEVEAKTFHKFGLDVITAVDGNKKKSIYDEKQFTAFIAKTFDDLVEDSEYLNRVTSFFIHYLRPIVDDSKFQNHGEHIQFLKDNNYRSYQLSSDKKTYKMEIVKSVEECQIANFLLFNGIDYQYELPYEFDTATAEYRRWKPDFTLSQDGKKIYLEHFGISRTGDIPHFFVKAGQTYEQAKAIYNNKIEWARETSLRYETALVESFSYEMKEGTLFKTLAKNLQKNEFEIRPMTTAEKWEIIQQAARHDINQTLKLFATFITLLKSNNYQIRDIIEKNSKIKDKFTRQRNSLMIEIITPIYKAYEDMLRKRDEIDFSDMINLASSYIESNKFHKKYKYIIVDEFQDISVSRFQLIKAIKTVAPDCKTFCVGDDWQSIYRFSGSDITLFKEFETYFGFSLKSKIETTYRFKNPLIEMSSNFIQKNPFQEKKSLKAFNGEGLTDYSIIYSETEIQDDTAALKVALDSIIANGGAEKETFLLGRYNFDFDRIKNLGGDFFIDRKKQTLRYHYDSSDTSKILEARYMTVHKSKGLEASNIIVLNCNAGRLGFPSQISDDTVLDLLLNKSDQFENGEERRLFYVAITRAKERLYLITDDKSKSKFIVELEGNDELLPIKKCPNCISSDLIKRSGITKNREWAFWGCSNYVYGCEFQEWL